MDSDKTSRKFESVFSKKVRAGKRRTYFFDVRKTKGEDYFITLTESTRKFNDQGYERHKIFLYKEDFNRFLSSLQETVDHIKQELMPDYDYDEFTKRNEEYEKRLKEGTLETSAAASTATEPVNDALSAVDNAATEVVETAEAVTSEVEESVTEVTEESTTANDTEESSEPKEDIIEDDMSW